MNIPYTDTIFLGIIRMFLWVLFIYILKRLFYPAASSHNQVKAMGYYWAFYGSITTITIFVLVLLNSFDLLTLIFLILGFFTLKLFNLRANSFSKSGWHRKKLSFLVNTIESVEKGRPLIDIAKKNKIGVRRFGIKTEFLVAFLAGLVAVLVRFTLMEFDNYQLSPAWFEELSVVVSILEQDWVSNKLLVTGEYGLMAFYSLITGISPEMALESFGLFQVFILCFVIFWFVDAMTTSLVTVPLVATLTFALFFNIVPINIQQITHSKQTLMALAFWMPAMIFIVRPWKLYLEKAKLYFVSIYLIFFAIALIDFFTLFMLIPPFFLVTSLFLRKRYFKYFVQALLAYLIAVGTILGYYYIESILQQFDFGLFFRSNLLSVQSTTTTDNMVFQYETISAVFQIVSLTASVIMYFLYRTKKNKWAAPMIFLLYINLMILISRAGFIYFDIDLFNEITPVFLASAIAIFYYLLYYLYSRYFNLYQSNWVLPPAIFILFTGLSFFSQKGLLDRTSNANTMSKNVLEAYELLKSSYIPYGYAVVNDSEMLPVSKGSHIFISYQDFALNYAERDSIFFANIEDKTFLKENDEYILPNSVLVFIYESQADEFDLKINLESEVNKQVINEMARLEEKGRGIRLFYQKGGLTVYEIINRPNLAKITELL